MQEHANRRHTTTTATERSGSDFERREPRCRVCRDERVRLEVNRLLDWHGIPIPNGNGKFRSVTYTDILRSLEPVNEGRDPRARITYDSLWVHAKRHYETAGVWAYWAVRLDKEFRKALRQGLGVESL